ncbi:MAG: copper oxidase, partial [Planctomycetaceae bacterium]
MMNSIRYRWIKVLQTLLRVLPFPCRTGLIVIGQPHRDAPVLLTCNFGLTVERVRRALTGL